jgi:4-amino-4-deoxy-L-arabinose transferase-like glycosyltransferase
MSQPHPARQELVVLLALLLIAAAVRLPSLLSRSIWEDETVTLLQTAGYFTPSWPSEPTSAGALRKHFFEGTPRLGEITAGLRSKDVHPPVYYWILSLWRRSFGYSLETARAFSVLCSLGTILALYALLRAGRFEHPLIPTLIYALSTAAVDYGSDARAYALTSFLITCGALCAYLASEAASRKPRLAVTYSLAMVACCGIAFDTNYLAIFPILIILAWFVRYLWAVWGPLTIIFPLLVACIGTLGVTTFLAQLGARPGQRAGFVGILAEMISLLGLTLSVIWIPKFIAKDQIRAFENVALLAAAYGAWMVLIGAAFVQLLRRWSDTNNKLWHLLLGLAIVPPLGVFFLDLLFDKHLHHVRYLLLAGPALAAVAAYGIIRLISLRPRLTIVVLVPLLGVQMAGIYWGFWPDDRRTDRWARMAAAIAASSSSSRIVVVPDSYMGEYPGSLIHELDKVAPQTKVLIPSGQSEEEMQSIVQTYDDVWIVVNYKLIPIVEGQVNEGLQTGEHPVEVLHHREAFVEALHLRRTVVVKSPDDNPLAPY